MLASPGVSHSVNTRTPSGNHHQEIRAKEQHLQEIFTRQLGFSGLLDTNIITENPENLKPKRPKAR